MCDKTERDIPVFQISDSVPIFVFIKQQQNNNNKRQVYSTTELIDFCIKYAVASEIGAS